MFICKYVCLGMYTLRTCNKTVRCSSEVFVLNKLCMINMSFLAYFHYFEDLNGGFEVTLRSVFLWDCL
jgi:hypothetical protein